MLAFFLLFFHTTFRHLLLLMLLLVSGSDWLTSSSNSCHVISWSLRSNHKSLQRRTLSTLRSSLRANPFNSLRPREPRRTWPHRTSPTSSPSLTALAVCSARPWHPKVRRVATLACSTKTYRKWRHCVYILLSNKMHILLQMMVVVEVLCSSVVVHGCYFVSDISSLSRCVFSSYEILRPLACPRIV